MSATIFVAHCSGVTAPDAPSADCGLCGAFAPARPWRDVLKPSFTALPDLHAEFLCWACEWALSTRATRSSHLAHGDTVRKLERKEFWPLLLDPPEPPFVIYLTESGQKHGLYLQRVAEYRELFRVQVDDWSCDFVPSRDVEWMTAAADARRLGVSRDAIASGDYSSREVLAMGKEYRWIEKVLERWRGTNNLRLLRLMPGKEDWISLPTRL